MQEVIRNRVHTRQLQQERAVNLADSRRRQRLSTAKKRMEMLMARQSGAPLLDGTGTAEQVLEKLLLFYRLTGVELTMPVRRVINGELESEDAAQERVRALPR